MYITSEQRKLISDTYGIRVKYSPIWKKMNQIGFCYKDHDGYHVRVDKELSKEARKIVLIHELGHIELDHLKINEYKEKVTVDEIITKVGAPKDLINRKLNGGFHDFMNICLDLEVNSKFLTFENYEIMRNETKIINGEETKLGVLNIEDWDMEYQSDFRGYYEPVILRLMNEEDCAMSKAMDTLKDWAKSMQESADRGQGEGQMMSDSELQMPGSSSGSGNGSGQSDQQSSSDSKPGDGKDKDSNGDESDGNSGSGGQDNSTSGGSGARRDKGGYAPKDTGSNDGSGSGNKGDRQSPGSDNDGDDSEGSTGSSGGDKSDSTESTVGQEFKENIDNQNKAPHSGYGTAYSNNSFELTNKNSIKMKEFLTGLISRQNTRLPDSMKLYNRGIRRNPQGLLYTSTRTKRNTDQMKLGILIDVSGSMDIDEISAAINSLGELKLSLHPQSKVVLWSTDLNQEWLITDKFPAHPNKGGGTDMLSGIRYLLKDGFTDIVVYSDWETSYMDSIIEEAKANCIYGIFVGANMKDKYNIELCKELRKWIEI